MTIPAVGTGPGVSSLYPSPITVSGLNGTVVDVNVTLTGLSHTFPTDIDVLLVGPAGQKVVLMADVGGGSDVVAIGLTFDDAAASSLPDNTQIVSGTFKPSVQFGGGFVGTAPAPAAPYLTTLAGFNGTAPNGTWNLFVFDDFGGDSGSMTGGWSLDILATPTITSFAPTSGGAGTAVVITGTSLTGTSAVRFNGISTTFTVNSATQVTATAPAGVTTGPISLTTPGGTATSATNFTVTPTITSFSPTSGKVGDAVVITGTNLTGTSAVRFNGTSATTFAVNSATQVTATVPAGAGTGPISLTTPGGTATSATNFVVKHARDVSLTLSGNKAKGTVSVTDGFTACRSGVPVKVQHRENGNWKTVGSTLTKSNGTYRVAGLTEEGNYRTLAKKTTLASGDVCLKDISPTDTK
jgi:subtilisin-like proprotein convertase family protein